MRDIYNWIYGSDFLTETPKAYGFIYEIVFSDGMRYIGKKNFYSRRKRNFGKKEVLALKDKRLKKYEYVTKESDWRTYCSSNHDVINRIKNGDDYTKQILAIAYHKKELTYLEEYSLNINSVLSRDDYYNDNIAGRFFTKDIKEWERTRKLALAKSNED